MYTSNKLVRWMKGERETQRFRFTNHMDAIAWTDSFKRAKKSFPVIYSCYTFFIIQSYFMSISRTLSSLFFPSFPLFFASLTFFSLNLMFLFSVLICFPPIGELSYGKKHYHKCWSLSGPRLVVRPLERAAVCVGADVCNKTCVVATWSSPDYLVFINH